MLSSRVMDLVQRQHGVVTRKQLYDLGVTRRTLSRRVAEGLWIPQGRDVLLARWTPNNLATRSRVAARRWPGAVLTGPSAAVLLGRGPWDGTNLGRTPWLIAPLGNRPGVRLVTHPGGSFRLIEGIRVATPTVAVIDLIRLQPVADAQQTAYRAAQSGLLTVPALAAAHERLRRCAGAEQLGAIIHDLTDGAHAESERLMLNLLQEAGIAGWRANHPIPLPDRTVFADVAFPDHRLLVELDGRAWHTAADRFQGDRTRQNALVRAGWIVLRFTWEDLTRRPAHVIREIRDILG